MIFYLCVPVRVCVCVYLQLKCMIPSWILANARFIVFQMCIRVKILGVVGRWTILFSCLWMLVHELYCTSSKHRQKSERLWHEYQFRIYSDFHRKILMSFNRFTVAYVSRNIIVIKLSEIALFHHSIAYIVWCSFRLGMYVRVRVCVYGRPLQKLSALFCCFIALSAAATGTGTSAPFPGLTIIIFQSIDIVLIWYWHMSRTRIHANAFQYKIRMFDHYHLNIANPKWAMSIHIAAVSCTYNVYIE